ncbi:STAS domain-containing protein [Nocardia thailandica]
MNTTQRPHPGDDRYRDDDRRRARPARLRIDTEPCGSTTVAHVRGDVDAATLAQWHALLDAAITDTAADGGRHLVVDLSDADFVSVRAVLDLAALTRQSCRRRVSISLVDARTYSATARIIAVAGLGQWLPVHADLIDALSAEKADVPRLQASTVRRAGPRSRRLPSRLSSPTGRG